MRTIRNISNFSVMIILSCILVLMAVKLIRNQMIYKANIVSVNNSIANRSAALDECKDLINTEFELDNMNIMDFELLTTNNFKITLNNINVVSEGLYLLYFPKIMCDKCIQEDIQKVYEKCSAMSNFYSIIPLDVAREIQSAYKNKNKENIYYYTESLTLLKEPIKPILLHLDTNYIIDRVFVIQKINTEFNEKFLSTI